MSLLRHRRVHRRRSPSRPVGDKGPDNKINPSATGAPGQYVDVPMPAACGQYAGAPQPQYGGGFDTFTPRQAV